MVHLLIEIAVVAQAQLDPVGQAGMRDALAGVGQLLARQGQAGDAVTTPGGILGKATPTATDLEDVLSG